MNVSTLIKEAEKADIHFEVIEDTLLVDRPKKTDPRLLEQLEDKVDELLRYVRTSGKLRELIPGGIDRMAFRRRVIDIAGMDWHMTPVALREDVVSKYLLSGKALSAALELKYLNS